VRENEIKKHFSIFDDFLRFASSGASERCEKMTTTVRVKEAQQSGEEETEKKVSKSLLYASYDFSLR
jgi:hypothetical protein